MNIQETYEQLEQEPTLQRRRQIAVDFLRSCADTLEASPSNRQTIAYDIAGLLSTEYARSCDIDPSIDIILVMAGELETTPPEASEWQELLDAIRAL